MSCRQSKKVTSRGPVRESRWRSDLESRVGRHPLLLGMRPRLLDGAGVEVVADEGRIRERLGHDYCREAVPAADVRHGRTALQLRRRRRPEPAARLHESGVVARTEEAPDGAEQARRLLAPADALAGAERRLDQRLVLEHGRREIKRALQINGAVSLANTIACSGDSVNVPTAAS